MEQHILEAISYQVLLLHVLMGHLPHAAEFVPLVVGGPYFYVNGLYFWLMWWRGWKEKRA